MLVIVVILCLWFFKPFRELDTISPVFQMLKLRLMI